jgi:dienelactone hydrolase
MKHLRAAKVEPRRGLILIAVFAALGGFTVAQTGAAPAATGRKALEYLIAEKYPELNAMFNATLKQLFTLDVLGGRFREELGAFGQAGSVGEPILTQDGKNTLVTFPVTYTKAKLNIQFSVEESGQLAAIHFRPADAANPTTWQRPPYSRPEMFREREVTIGADPWKLGATLTIPVGKGPFPAVILVHGPGPNDRDESIRANKVFADIAEGLSSRGIAVLRYDKRTLAYGRQMSQTGYTLRQETIDDALAAAAFMRLQPEITVSRIYLLGHSLGGYAAPRIAREDGKLAGLIFLAANSRPIEELVLDQTEYLAAAGVLPPEEAKKRLDSLKVETEKMKALEPGASNPPVVLGLPSEWLLDVKNYEPTAQAASLSIPLLFLQGERDFQVGQKDFDRWKSALAKRPNATFHSYPDLNHLFISGKGRSLPAEYVNPANVSPAVIGDIADWIAASKN